MADIAAQLAPSADQRRSNVIRDGKGLDCPALAYGPQAKAFLPLGKPSVVGLGGEKRELFPPVEITELGNR